MYKDLVLYWPNGDVHCTFSDMHKGTDGRWVLKSAPG